MRGNTPAAVGFAAYFSFRSSYSHDVTPPADGDEEKVSQMEGPSSIRFSRTSKASVSLRNFFTQLYQLPYSE
jgi:hypothetical protein